MLKTVAMQGHVQNRLLSNKILCLFLFVSDLYHCCRAERYKYIKNYIMKNLILKSLNGLVVLHFSLCTLYNDDSFQFIVHCMMTLPNPVHVKKKMESE